MTSSAIWGALLAIHAVAATTDQPQTTVEQVVRKFILTTLRCSSSRCSGIPSARRPTMASGPRRRSLRTKRNFFAIPARRPSGFQRRLSPSSSSSTTVAPTANALRHSLWK